METIVVSQTLANLLFPSEISLHFEASMVKEYPDRIEIRMEELRELIPEKLSSKEEVVLDGFCNPIELQSFPLKGKPVYLKLYRRRWKEKGGSKHFSNVYDLHADGVKATKDFASFLKEAFGQSPDQYNSDSKSTVC